MKNREDSGISLPEIHRDLKQDLLSGPPEEDSPERQLIFKGGQMASYRHEGEPVPNIVRNQKYSVVSFVPLVLFKEFQYFFNLFYLLTAVSQFIPALKVGLLFSFLAPLVLVLFLTMLK